MRKFTVRKPLRYRWPLEEINDVGVFVGFYIATFRVVESKTSRITRKLNDKVIREHLNFRTHTVNLRNFKVMNFAFLLLVTLPITVLFSKFDWLCLLIPIHLFIYSIIRKIIIYRGRVSLERIWGLK